MRGASLVDAVIDQCPQRFPGPGMTEAELAAITLNGKPLPPSLRRYLQRDTAWAEFDFKPVKLSQLMGDAFSVIEQIIPGDCFSMRASYSDSTWWFLYTGETDEAGEYPVFLADIDDWYLVKIEYAGFDQFLACQTLGPNAPECRGWNEDVVQQSHLNFRGYSFLEIHGEAATIDGRKVKWQGLPVPNYDDL